MASNYLMHYGVKGMKWGVRNDYVPTGQYRYIHRQRGSDTTSSRSRRSSGSSGQYATPQQRRIMNRIKIAKGTAIAAGTIMAAVGAYKWGKVLKSPAGQRAINRGRLAVENKLYEYMNYGRNIKRLATNTTRAVTAPIRNNVAVRSAGRILSAPKRVLGGSRAGQIALKAYGAATLASDINSTQQWVRKVKSNGKITGKDVGDLAKDLINPLPDNIPYINKNARENRRKKKNQNGGRT